jgi:hypothetical protein
MVEVDGSGNVLVSVHVQPGARRAGVAGRHGAALKLRVTARPVDGKANAAVVALLADLLALPRASITLVSGATSRQKRLRITAGAGTDAAALAARVTALADDAGG